MLRSRGGPRPRPRSSRIRRLQSQSVTITRVPAGLEANVISRVQQRVDLFEVIDDRVVDVPDQARLLGRPFVVSLDRDAVIGVVKGLAILPVRSEHLGEAAVGPAPWGAWWFRA